MRTGYPNFSLKYFFPHLKNYKYYNDKYVSKTLAFRQRELTQKEEDEEEEEEEHQMKMKMA